MVLLALLSLFSLNLLEQLLFLLMVVSLGDW